MHNISNFRDLGNIPTPQGNVKPALLYRGTPLHDLNTKILHNLQDHFNIKTVIDLRDDHEVNKKPDTTAGFEYIRLNILGKTAQVSANPLELLRSKSNSNPHDMMLDIYKTMVLDEHAQAMYREFFAVLLRSDTGVYFHCSAGKDRTGLAAAFILKVLGASDADIMKDYLLTNEMVQGKWEHRILRMMSEYNFSKDQAMRFRAFFEVHEDYLRMAQDTINAHFDGFDHYAAEVLALNPEKLALLKAKYLNQR